MLGTGPFIITNTVTHNNGTLGRRSRGASGRGGEVVASSSPSCASVRARARPRLSAEGEGEPRRRRGPRPPSAPRLRQARVLGAGPAAAAAAPGGLDSGRAYVPLGRRRATDFTLMVALAGGGGEGGAEEERRRTRRWSGAAAARAAAAAEEERVSAPGDEARPDRYQCLKTAVPLCHHETSLEPSCLPRGAAPLPTSRPTTHRPRRLCKAPRRWPKEARSAAPGEWPGPAPPPKTPR